MGNKESLPPSPPVGEPPATKPTEPSPNASSIKSAQTVDTDQAQNGTTEATGLSEKCHFIPLKEETDESAVKNNAKRRNLATVGKPASFTSTSSERSTDSIPIPSLHGSLLQVHQQRDPLRYYDIIKVLGDGSMGNVSKVQKRQSAVGGSARREFVKAEKRLEVCFGMFSQCWMFCPIDADETSRDLLDTSGLSGSDSQAGIPGDGKNARGGSASSIISYERADVTYALKSIHMERVKDNVFRQELLNEIAILQRLDHPHVVKAMETFDFRNRLYLVLELCSGGDLYARDPYDEIQACRIANVVFDAVAYMHFKGITHRDLKFENIMFASPTSNLVKVIDFGLSKKYSQEEHLHETVGTVYTMAPEVLTGDYDNKCDVWSMGVIAFMLLSSSLPFYGKSRQHVVRKILHGKYGFKGHRWKPITSDAKEFVMDCLVPKPRKRPTANESLRHPWLRQGEDTNGMQISFSLMDRVQATIQTFAEYGRLKKLALLVVAYKSTNEEIGFLRKVFKSFDVVQDGEISPEEFKEALAIYHYDDADVEHMFTGMDLDGTGRVKYSEFLAATIEAHGVISEERIAEAFDRMDCDSSGYITTQNILDFLGDSISEDYADAVIEEADITMDNRISYEEFLALWDAGNDHKLKKALKDVEYRRVSFDDSSLDTMSRTDSSASLESTDDMDFSGVTTEGSENRGGTFFFGVEKQKSVRGVWV